MCDVNTILGASDRMVTAGDVQFQPPQPKIWQLTTSIVAMIAGDIPLQTEILIELTAEVNRRIKANPQDWLNVKDVADLYSHYYSDIRRRKAEKRILHPLGLDSNTYISRQKEMSPELVSKVANELVNFELPVVEVIFSGIDTSGGHLYIVRDGSVTCEDQIGFAVIGIGYSHANSALRHH